MAVPILTVLAALTLELAWATCWSALGPRLMEELLALGACVLVGVALLARCCCCCRLPLSPLASRWATLVALLTVVVFVLALFLTTELFQASALLIPALAALLSLLVQPPTRSAAAQLALSLATSAAAAAGTGAPAELLGALHEQTSLLILAASCALATAVQWVGVQRALNPAGRGTEPRVSSASLVAAVLVRAAAMLVVAAGVLVALAGLAGQSRVQRTAAELLLRAPHPEDAMGGVEDALLAGDECARLPLASALAATALPGGGFALHPSNASLTPCWHVPERLTRCVSIGSGGLQYCATARGISLALIAALFASGTLALYAARFALIGELGAPSLASACVLARLGALGLALIGVARTAGGGGGEVGEGGKISSGSSDGRIPWPGTGGTDASAAAAGAHGAQGADPFELHVPALGRAGATLCFCAAAAALLQLACAMAAPASKAARAGAEGAGAREQPGADEESAGFADGRRLRARGGSAARRQRTSALGAGGAAADARASERGRARAHRGARDVRALDDEERGSGEAAVSGGEEEEESEFALFKRWRRVRRLRELHEFSHFLASRGGGAAPAQPAGARGGGGSGDVPVPLRLWIGPARAPRSRAGYRPFDEVDDEEEEANEVAEETRSRTGAPAPPLASDGAQPGIAPEPRRMPSMSAQVPASAAEGGARPRTEGARGDGGSGSDGDAPPEYEAVIRSPEYGGAARSLPSGRGASAGSGQLGRWPSAADTSVGDDGGSDAGAVLTARPVCARCGFVAHGLAALQEHARTCPGAAGAAAVGADRAGGAAAESAATLQSHRMY